MKKLVNQSKRLGVIALASMSLVAFSACGGGDEAEALIKKEYPDAKVLSFDEAKKEVGLTDKECLKIKKVNHLLTFLLLRDLKISLILWQSKQIQRFLIHQMSGWMNLAHFPSIKFFQIFWNFGKE